VIHVGASAASPLQSLLGEGLALRQPRVHEWLQRVLPIRKGAWKGLGVLPEREPGHFARREVPQGERPDFLIEGTERRRQRPKSPQPQAAADSGKKETQWDKNVGSVQAQRQRVGCLSQT
jgi:hypothetical protein